jgi:hypothetical protein
MYPHGPRPCSFILSLSELCQRASDHYLPLKMVTALYAKTPVQHQHTILLWMWKSHTRARVHTHTLSYPLNQEFATMTAKCEVNKTHKIYEVCKIYSIIAIQTTVNISYTVWVIKTSSTEKQCVFKYLSGKMLKVLGTDQFVWKCQSKAICF